MPRGQKKDNQLEESRHDVPKDAEATKSGRKARKERVKVTKVMKSATANKRGKSKSQRKRGSVKSKRAKKVVRKVEEEGTAAKKAEKKIEASAKQKKLKKMNKSKSGFRSERASRARPYKSKGYKKNIAGPSELQAVYNKLKQGIVVNGVRVIFDDTQEPTSLYEDCAIDNKEEDEVEDDKCQEDLSEKSLQYTQYDSDDSMDTPLNSLVEDDEPKMRPFPEYYPEKCLRSDPDKDKKLYHIEDQEGTFEYHTGKGIRYVQHRDTWQKKQYDVLHGAKVKLEEMENGRKKREAEEKKRQKKEDKQLEKKKKKKV